MDTGVGCAIFASALVAREAMGSAASAAKAGCCTGLRQAAPLLALGTRLAATCSLFTASNRPAGWQKRNAACAGGARAWATRASGYEVDASEYGEHWNFFLTLGVLVLLNAFACIPARWLVPIGKAKCPLIAFDRGLMLFQCSIWHVNVF